MRIKEIYTEYFAIGTEPEETCPLHELVPETEPIYIYQDILDQLITETESESESESESETSSETVTESESSSESESTSEFDTESETDTDVNQWIPENGETLPQTPVPHQLDTSSFDDLMNRLAEEMQYQNFAFP